MRLKCWGSNWGLPSIDIDCLAVLTYSFVAKVPIEKIECLPRNSIGGILPELEDDQLVYSEPLHIISVFRREGYNQDYGLTDDESADVLAYIALIEQRLRPAILYALWIDAENYTKITRPAYGNACRLPWSLWYPQRIRQNVEDYIMQFKGNENVDDFYTLDKIVYKEARSCLNLLENRLGKKQFFFGNSPSTFDAILYGHLGILLRSPLASTELQNYLNACGQLKRFCERMEQFLPGGFVSPTKVPPAKKMVLKKKQLISLAVAVVAMAAYAMFSGVLTGNRSRLAQKLKKYKSERRTTASEDFAGLESLD